jgi:hypothetical protein
VSGAGKIQEKWMGDSPSPLILSLGGARMTTEKGYHRPQGQGSEEVTVTGDQWKKKGFGNGASGFGKKRDTSPR